MRTLRRRPTILLATLLFVGGVSAEPWDMHGCIHHGGLPLEGAAHGPHGLVAHGHGAHGDDGVASADEGAEDDGGTHGDGPCTCVGSCGVAGGASFAPAAAAAALPWASAVTRRDAATSAAPRAGPLPHLLPWATAPPVPVLAARP